MNILHISMSDSGAGNNSVFRLHQSFLRAGHNSKMLVRNKYSLDENVIRSVVFQQTLKNKWFLIKKHLKRIKTNCDYSFLNVFEKDSYISTKKIIKEMPFKPDVIILQWISGLINCRNIFELEQKTGAKIIWQLMDMGAFTGGCHYAWDCKGYERLCGMCPAINSYNSNDISALNFLEKKRYLPKTQLSIVAPSTMLYEQVSRSSLLKDKIIKKIMIAVDPVVFQSNSKEAIRKELGIPIDAKVIFFGARTLAERRKGAQFFAEALRCLDKSLTPEIRSKSHVLIIGGAKPPVLNDLPFSTTFINYLNSEKEAARVYQAADLYVCSSIEDSGPMMVNEMIMSGVPVVAFKVGVVSDLISDGVTGYCAKIRDSKDLALGIKRVLELSAHDYQIMSNNCRSLGLRQLSPEVQVAEYQKLFTEISL